MTFELWIFTDGESRCFARRTAEQVKQCFHDMEIAEQRHINGDHYIMRVK